MSLNTLRIVITVIAVFASGYCASATMKAHYIDLGQADSTLLEFECGVVLVDAGAQTFSNAKSTAKLMTYLDRFFTSRPELGGVIDSIIITHNHDDHTESLNEVADKYIVKNIVSTEFNLKKDVTNVVAHEANVKHRYLTYTDAKANIPNGLLYSEIDPLGCESEDPIIAVYTGQSDVLQTTTINGIKFTKTAFTNPNNNSLVIKVTFGKASFIFTGDLEDKGIEYLLATYANNLSVLDADVYQVGHHGSLNGTTHELLDAVSPSISIISAGHSIDQEPGSAWDHGHPNRSIVSMLTNYEKTGRRPYSVYGDVFDEQESNPSSIQVIKEVYCTCWDHNIVIEADSEVGILSVTTNQ